MATHDYVIDNSTGANVRADINLVLQAILTNNSSSSAPSTTAAYMWWADTTNGVLKIRNSSNNDWVELLQLDGTLTLEDGSASTPALAFRDDLNTGIFSSAADTFNVATAGVERMELGATTIFNEDGADVDFRIEGDTEANLFYVDAGNDRVGIGTSSPSSLLNLDGGSSNAFVEVDGTGRYRGFEIHEGGSRKAYFHHDLTGNLAIINTVESVLAFHTGDTENMRLSGANLGIGTTSPSTLLHANLAAENGSIATFGLSGQTNNQSFIIKADDSDSLFTFRFGSSNSTYPAVRFNMGADAEALRIDSSGRVLIGSTTADDAAQMLKVARTSGTARLAIQAANDGSSQLDFADVADADVGRIQYDHSSNSMALFTDNSERLRIDNIGNTLVGATSSIEVASSAEAQMQITQSADGSRLGLALISVFNGSGPAAILALGHGRGSTSGVLQDNDIIGQIRFAGGDGTDCQSQGASINCEVDGTPGTNDMPGRLVFKTTADGAAATTERIRIDSSGDLFVGCSSHPSSSVTGFSIHNGGGGHHFVRSATGNTSLAFHYQFINPNGAVGVISTSGSSTTYSTSSDYRLKENATAISDGITRLKTLKPYRFNFKADASTTVDGFFAHEVTAVPEAIIGTKDEVDADNNPVYQGIDQSKLVPLLVAAVQELITKVETLEAA